MKLFRGLSGLALAQRSGPGGIVSADRLSANGKNVLLIERGPPSKRRWGGRRRGRWLENSNLTRFDVPGLWFKVSMLFLDFVVVANISKPQSLDWDSQFPDSWKAEDLSAATDRAFERVPWSSVPSSDGILYNREASDLITKGLISDGWTTVEANSEPNAKNKTVSQSEYFFQHGERRGLLETYLVSAVARGNFKLWMNTLATRVERNRDSVTGVQVEPSGDGGYNGTVKLAAGGRVIISAGVFGTAKILFRSGIGPKDQLDVVQKAEPEALIDSAQWIDLPISHNLDDHLNTNVVFEHPDIVNYDFNSAYNNPIPDDAAAYLNTSGIAAALGLGKTSRGRVTINSSLVMDVSVLPYFNDDGNHDFEAVVATVSGVVKAISSIPGATMINPVPGQEVRDYVRNLEFNAGRTANHWVVTTRLGTDSALEGGKSVVDLNAQVYGTRNLHVVDAVILNGVFTANPQAGIVIAAEKVAEAIIKLHG
ncbi:fungal cellulose binding domain-containing protein [Colletotrichum salicis]|uniref:Fungal cellulose binding domain-containing protein n=1 Tax=Colletotrichum salicis TaxID=1209931 RepID=A0A135U526_9PEZI|nr:fungal cellulose binding domain-containing protein [Colletotrichum salicis]